MLTMLFPIGDDNSDRHITPYVTYVLIALNVAVFVLLQLPNDAFTYGYSVIPAEILSGRDFTEAIPIGRSQIPQAPGPTPIYLTILSAMFMHGGWAHLGGNLLFLWIFGDNVEDAMDHFKFALFYILCGVLATFAHIIASQVAGGANLLIPSLGASGAIAGVLGGYLVLYPRKSVRVLIGWFGIFALPAFLVIGGWMAMQLFSGVGDIVNATAQTRESGGVAYWAHIGGAIAGAILVNLFRNRDVARRALERATLPAQSPFFRD